MNSSDLLASLPAIPNLLFRPRARIVHILRAIGSSGENDPVTSRSRLRKLRQLGQRVSDARSLSNVFAGGARPFPSLKGSVEKSRQRRSRPFAVLTYYQYAPRVKRAAALLDELF